MSKHTAPPWNIDHVNPWPNCPGVHDFKIKDKNGRGVVRIEALPDWEEMGANADLIVEAVNNYDALRAELDAAKSRIEHLETNLNAALTCATIGDIYKARGFMTKGLKEASES